MFIKFVIIIIIAVVIVFFSVSITIPRYLVIFVEPLWLTFWWSFLEETSLLAETFGKISSESL